MLRDQINNGIKDAMKSGEKLKLSTLRLVNAAIKKRAAAARARSTTRHSSACSRK
jgi:uncharacterized protein YqeY